MSIQSEIDRIALAKNAIRNAIEAKGVSVPQEVSIDDYASKVDAIQAGGGVVDRRISYHHGTGFVSK